MKIYFNTHTFDEFIKEESLDITNIPQETEFLVLGAKKVDYSKFTKLKAVYRFGVGTDNIDFKYLKNINVPVYFPSEKAKEILYDATANFTVYGIIHVLYREAFGDINLWKKKQREYIGEKIALVIGTGNIGKRVLSKLSLFMKTKSFDITANAFDELKPLVKEADIITIHIPLNKDTESFFNEEKLSWAKDKALFINTARGSLFDEEALYRKLKNSNCRAFFDVFWQEPYKGKLKDLGQEKFFMTPHSASNTREFLRAGFNDILNISRKG
ncbi:MAG: NAD(P)-dependent oxidoreductase [Candidatus Omnitrophica bacterium]|nr:NAD(P)-dependent oxidoreductase [Candidatus Omnitrophota bacterium]MDD5430516.1 NAD(P)-dependent oxidoreductase [Candidatus Omnitrophota bacterium]